ncbi:MAG: HdeD family acid-resistance protein [Candidatus Aphodosoma sp.]
MMNHLKRTAEKAGKIIRHWWLILITGILSIGVGIAVFVNPVESYLTLSILFGIMMLVSGIAELAVSVTSRNYFTTRTYNIIGGILDILLGIFLCAYPQVTLIILPIVLGIWLLYHSFMVIGFGSDMDAFRIPGSGWTIAGGIVLLVLSILILVKPFSIGTTAVVSLTGAAFIVFGIMGIAVSLRLRKIHKLFKYDDATVIDSTPLE